MVATWGHFEWLPTLKVAAACSRPDVHLEYIAAHPRTAVTPLRMLSLLARRSRLSPRNPRAVVAALAAAGYLATIVGYPAAAPRGAKAGGSPFPCQNHSCGCTTAAECWGHCCCFTKGERLAWSARHNVAPPRDVTVKVIPRLAANTTHDSGGACEKEHEDAASASRSCCAKSGGAHKPKIDWTVVMRARGCRGVGNDWVVFNSPIAPPPAHLVWRPADDAVEILRDSWPDSPEVSYAPPTPPA
jgi:hypothetical protein